MPRVSKGAAVFIALVMTTAGISAVASLSLFSPAVATIGGHVPVRATLAGGSNQTVYLFAGTARGTTTVTVNGANVSIPVAGNVFSAGSSSLVHGSTTISASIPADQTLIGEQIIWVAVVVDGASGRIICISRTGGPIIEDAIC